MKNIFIILFLSVFQLSQSQNQVVDLLNRRQVTTYEIETASTNNYEVLPYNRNGSNSVQVPVLNSHTSESLTSNYTVQPYRYSSAEIQSSTVPIVNNYRLDNLRAAQTSVNNSPRVVYLNTNTQNTRVYSDIDYYREANRQANKLALTSLVLGVVQSQWRDGRILNPYPLLPADMRYRPQRYLRTPIYIGRNYSPFLNNFDRTRYWNNYNGGQPVYGRSAYDNNFYLRAHAPLNWLLP